MSFYERIRIQYEGVSKIPWTAKFGGATGNLNALHVAYPDKDWSKFAKDFLAYIGLERDCWTKQIGHQDSLAAFLDGIVRLNTICIDLCQDIWLYCSYGYFRINKSKNQIGTFSLKRKKKLPKKYIIFFRFFDNAT